MAECGSGAGLTLVYNAVQQGQGSLFTVAYDAINGVNAATQALDALISGLTPLDTDIDLENAGKLSDPFDIGSAPTPNVAGYVDQNADYKASLTIPAYSDTSTKPADFTKAAPVLDPIARPDDLNVEAPGPSPEIGDYPFPDDPTDEIPPPPALLPIVIPDIPPIEFPDFDGNYPGDFVEDDFGVFSWTPEDYTATVREEVTEQIKAILGGSTGIPDHVWDMIYERAVKQLRATSNQAKEEAVDYWAGKGHFLSNGALRKRVKEASDVEREGTSDLVREFVIQDSKIYVERLNTALAQGIALEQQLIGLYNVQQERDFQVAKTIFDIALQVANYRLGAYSTKLQAYKIQADVFQTLIMAEVAKLEVVKVELEAQKLIGQLNMQTLEVYKTQILAVTAVYDLFKTQVEAVAVKYDADKTRVEAYAEEVKAYGERIRAWTAEWTGYSESVKAEVAKVTAYGEEASAYLSTVQAYGTNVTADKNKHDGYIASEKLKIERMQVSVAQLGEDVRGESAKVDAAVKVETLDMRGYEASASAEQSRVSSDAQRLQVLTQNANMRMQAQIQETQLKVQEAQNKLGAQTSGLNAILQANAQLASSALAALNYAMALGGDVREQSSCSDIYNHES